MRRVFAIVSALATFLAVGNVPGMADDAPASNKTLVAWVSLDNPNLRAGSVLTIQSGDEFDGIIFAERQPGKWMAGSNFYRRTEGNQDKVPAETADAKTLVQVAIVYHGDQITIYRNGQQLTSYKTENIDLLGRKDNFAVFGLRHIGGNGCIGGSIDDARIYARALTADEISSLRPNQESVIAPYAWWDFEGDKVTDRAGRFPFSRLEGGAKLAGGRLVLGEKSVMLAARTKAAVDSLDLPGVPVAAGPYVEETPAMPEEVPENWLTYHLGHPGPGSGFPGDPNCAFFYKGTYHLHYIYRNRWGFCFAHVSSKDMVTWTWHPTKLVPTFTGHGMFSGTGFFTKQGQPAIIYHGQGSGRNQIALALDDNLDQWAKPEAMVVKAPEGAETQVRHWDPDCWLNGDTYYAISGGGPPLLMKSADLKEWTFLGKLLHDDMPNLGVDKNEDVSCANMFRIGNKWMLLCISHRLGCRYYLGDFKDEKFLPDFHAMMNWRRWDFFAPESLLTEDGRRVMWAWCNMPGAQTAIQSLPRELSLPADGVLRIRPLREMEKLRSGETDEGELSVKSDSSVRLAHLAGDLVELSVTIKPTTAKEFGVSVFCDAAGKGFPIAYLPESKVLSLGEIKPPLELKPGEDLNLRIFLDKGMVEVFANERQAAVYMQPHDKQNVGIQVFGKGGEVSARVKGWTMRSIYAKP
jgi:beta-fructofuranosidase